MKLPIPPELADQLASTAVSMDAIVTELQAVKGLLQELVDLEKAKQ